MKMAGQGFLDEGGEAVAQWGQAGMWREARRLLCLAFLLHYTFYEGRGCFLLLIIPSALTTMPMMFQ